MHDPLENLVNTEACNEPNPSAPDMTCDLPKDDHAEDQCPVDGCLATHEGKHANHSKLKQKEVYQWRSSR